MTTKTKTQLRPLANRVLAQRLEEEAMKGGIILPDSARKNKKQLLFWQ